jgi:hypothetical protein
VKLLIATFVAVMVYLAFTAPPPANAGESWAWDNYMLCIAQGEPMLLCDEAYRMDLYSAGVR